MENLFNNILVPVDFSPATPYIVNKAVEIARAYSSNIHLLHVSPESWSPAVTTSVDDLIQELKHSAGDDMQAQMIALADHISILSEQEVGVSYSLKRGTWDEQVIETANHNKCDLVLIGRQEGFGSGHKLLFDPDRLATLTDLPVITIPYGRRLTHIYSVLIPVTDFLPLRKLMYGTYIATKNQASVKLLGVETPRSKDKVMHFLKASYELIHDTSRVCVSLAMSNRANVAAALNALAAEEAADLILVNPRVQTEMPKHAFHRHHPTLEATASSPVLVINPL